VNQDQLEVMPAYWWLYNMYALARNSWKFQNRDSRKTKIQHIEFDPFAPDTVEEIFSAMTLMEIWTGQAARHLQVATSVSPDDQQLAEQGRKLLSGDAQLMNGLEVVGQNMENTKRKSLILKPFQAYHAYQDMLHYYVGMNLIRYMRLHPGASFSDMREELQGEREKEWINLGGQIMMKKDLDLLRSDIGTGKLDSWAAIHHRYDELWEKYPKDKMKHAWATLCDITGTRQISLSHWDECLTRTVVIQQHICDQVYASRKKDYDNPFRQSTFRNQEEMHATLGTIDDNSFIRQVKKETGALQEEVEAIRLRK
jgi:hypothetical protein